MHTGCLLLALYMWCLASAQSIMPGCQAPPLPPLVGNPPCQPLSPEQHSRQWLRECASSHDCSQLLTLQTQQPAAQVITHALLITQLQHTHRGSDSCSDSSAGDSSGSGRGGQCTCKARCLGTGGTCLTIRGTFDAGRRSICNVHWPLCGTHRTLHTHAV